MVSSETDSEITDVSDPESDAGGVAVAEAASPAENAAVDSVPDDKPVQPSRPRRKPKVRAADDVDDQENTEPGNAAYILYQDPTKNDPDNQAAPEELDEILKRSKKGGETGYYKTLAEQDGETSSDMNQAIDDGFAGFEDPQLVELTAWGKFYRRWQGAIDKGDHFMLVGGKGGQVSDEALRQAVIGLVLEKGFSTLYFYDQNNKIDSTLTARANIMLSTLKQPGHALHDPSDPNRYANVQVSQTLMERPEPWRGRVDFIGIPFASDAVNRAINSPLTLMAKPFQPLSDLSHRYGKWKQDHGFRKAGHKGSHAERSATRSMVRPDGSRVGDALTQGEHKQVEPSFIRRQLTKSYNLNRLAQMVMPGGRAARKQMKAQEKAMQEAQVREHGERWRAQHRPDEVAAEQKAREELNGDTPDTDTTVDAGPSAADTDIAATAAATATATASSVASGSEIDELIETAAHTQTAPASAVNGSSSVSDESGSGESGGSSSGGGQGGPEAKDSFTASADPDSKQAAAKTGRKVKQDAEKSGGETFDPKDGLTDHVATVFDGTDAQAASDLAVAEDAPAQETPKDTPEDTPESGPDDAADVLDDRPADHQERDHSSGSGPLPGQRR